MNPSVRDKAIAIVGQAILDTLRFSYVDRGPRCGDYIVIQVDIPVDRSDVVHVVLQGYSAEDAPKIRRKLK